ncbi:glycosyltransferase [Nostocoides sp. Soil756]|uniref:glycosyltransferase n=1 Tax=Nostocoides sp. Soil756 TaxID=1736399 RepID=UPI0009EC29F0|nr:glycosyltransferase [Tetrasphaera sp. Soil756]
MIGWYVHHVGRGHATRAAAVARQLTLRGQAVTGLGSAPPPGEWRGEWVVLERDDRSPEPSDVTAHGVLHWAPRHDAGLAARAATIAEWAARCRPDLLVVDVSVEVALLARLCGVPVVVAALPGERTDPAHALAHDVADALLAPWPAGAHGHGWPRAWTEKTWAVGSVSRFDGHSRRAPRPHPRPRVLLLWGAGGRATTVAQVAAARAATPGWEWVEWSPALPESLLWDALLDADVVVTHGGQNAVAEVAAARRPAVVVAQPRPFDEQEATAAALSRMGIAVGLDTWPEAQRWPELLDRARRLGGDAWNRWSTGTGAADLAARLDDLASGLSAGRPEEADDGAEPHPVAAPRDSTAPGAPR